MKIISLVLATLLLATTAHAGDPNGRYHIVGAGAVTCQQYNAANEQQQLYAETWWAGYVTALNRTTPDTYHLLGATPVEQVNAMMRDYCAANPGNLLAVAVHAVVEQLYSNRQRRSPN